MPLLLRVLEINMGINEGLVGNDQAHGLLPCGLGFETLRVPTYLFASVPPPKNCRVRQEALVSSWGPLVGFGGFLGKWV